ncbi:MAG TPA: hypothetical protein DIS93_04800 [Bdellovibrionales bacterium]|nr:hypothetical protein [Bdellovibrionales bacterium]
MLHGSFLTLSAGQCNVLGKRQGGWRLRIPGAAGRVFVGHSKGFMRELKRIIAEFPLPGVKPKDEGCSMKSKQVSDPNIIKKAHAMRVIFFYPGEEGTCVDHAEVTLYANGIVHIETKQEETTAHLQNCEILWHYKADADDRPTKVHLLSARVPQAEI